MEDYYQIHRDTINKIPLAKLHRIPNKEKPAREDFFVKGYLYSRDDMDAYLNELAGL